MVTKRFTMRTLAGLTLWAGFGLTAQAQLPAVKVEEAVKVMPRQGGVNATTPTPEQVARCKVESIPDAKDPKTIIGYVVRDPEGKPVRNFVSYDGKSYNIIVFYVNGVEAYREVYPPQPDQPYQFRWLGPNGSKWGIDKNRDGKIDEWVAISPEELSQELLQAVLTRDVARAQALTVTKANLDAIGLPAAEGQKLLERATAVGKKVIDAADALKATPNARWEHLQLAAPQATPADAIGARDDLVVYKNGTVLVQDGANNTKFLQIGELVQVGRAWKLVDGPGSNSSETGPGGPDVTPEIAELVVKLQELDKISMNLPTQEAVAAYNARRAEILEQIVAKLAPEKQETWLKLLIDALSAASEGEKRDGKHISRLKQIKETLAKGPNITLAAYVGFRFLVAENNVAIATANSDDGGFGVVQQKWRAALEEFVKAYPNTEEAPEALLRLAMAYEYQKEGEATAKEKYAQLAREYAKHPHASKALGAIRRLESEGKPVQLSGPNLAGGPAFNAAGLQGKVVVVYYCASWSRTLPEDAKKLQSLVKEYGPKGLELVTVCLDNDARTAAEAVTKNGIPGTHLHAPGGLDASPLASGYGILVVPHLFVIKKDGTVANRNAQMLTVEDDVKKLLMP